MAKKKLAPLDRGLAYVKLTKGWGMNKKGATIVVDEVRAAAMVERGECKIVEVD